MARTSLTKTTAPGAYSDAGVAATLTAADVANGNQCILTGTELVIAQNTGASAHAITITSSNDPYNRAGSITAESIAAGAIRIFGPFKTTGWIQSDGMLYLSADHAEVKFAIVKLPG